MKKLITVVLAAMGCLAAEAQIPKPDPDTTAKHFLIVASIGNLQEASAGQLAVQKSRRADVKSFGEMMVRETMAMPNKSCCNWLSSNISICPQRPQAAYNPTWF